MENTYQLRTFADVLNQWTEALVAENKRPDADSYALMLLMRIGPLAQRLITEANIIGMQEGANMIKERSDAKM